MRFNRWRVYPKDLLEKQNVSGPITITEIINLETPPMLVPASVFLNFLEIGLGFLDEVVEYIFFRPKED